MKNKSRESSLFMRFFFFQHEPAFTAHRRFKLEKLSRRAYMKNDTFGFEKSMRSSESGDATTTASCG